jgi:molybdopterin-binding protein
MIEILGHFSVGSRVGILVKPEDIILSRETIRTSARNMIKAEITNIINYDSSSGVVDVHLKADRFHIISRITGQAREELGLQNHDSIFAIFKASSPQIIREE